MIRVVIEIDDPGDMADCAKEAVAERLSDLGRVRVADVQVDRPKQITFRDGVYRYEWRKEMKHMAYYRVCPDCGAALDPGEICDCRTQNSGEERLETGQTTPAASAGDRRTAWTKAPMKSR